MGDGEEKGNIHADLLSWKMFLRNVAFLNKKHSPSPYTFLVIEPVFAHLRNGRGLRSLYVEPFQLS
jgi:hypothetical protein